MEIILTVKHNCEGDGGNIVLQRRLGDQFRDMGSIKYTDSGERKWLLAVLMDNHPYVSLVDQPQPCIAEAGKSAGPC
jgi:hypothetical protein